jgi:hypothetical protein
MRHSSLFVVTMLSVVMTIGCKGKRVPHGDTLSFRGERDSVSLIALIAMPEKYEGREVDVAGYLIIEDDNNAVLFVGEGDYRHGLNKNGIRIVFPSEILAKRTVYTKHYVSIRGIFTADYKYRDILYSGAIKELRCIGLVWTPDSGQPSDLHIIFLDREGHVSTFEQ